MTKVSVFGKQPTETKELKKIEFVKYLIPSGQLEDALKSQEPKYWHNVQLFKKCCYGDYDTIIAWDEKEDEDEDEEKAIFLGYWNDGVV